MNKIFKKYGLLGVLFLLLVACNNTPKTTINNWDGTYVGVLPCADCDGIMQIVQLNKDTTYSLFSKYLGTDLVPIKRLQGTFNLIGDTVHLEAPRSEGNYSFLLEKDQIKYLMDGSVVTGELADKYILHKSQKTGLELLDSVLTTKKEEWMGKYYGILPCADCGGIEYELTLGVGNTYHLMTHYLAENSKYDSIEGHFVWGNNKTTILLKINNKVDSSYQFKIEENQLRYLDSDGSIIEGNLKNYYLLQKEGNNNVEDVKWDIVSIAGKSIEDTTSNHFFIQFHSKDGRVEVKANCNLISLGYRILNLDSLSFTKGMSTMMACPESKDKAVLTALENTKTLSLDDSIMTFYGANGKALIQFKK